MSIARQRQRMILLISLLVLLIVLAVALATFASPALHHIMSSLPNIVSHYGP